MLRYIAVLIGVTVAVSLSACGDDSGDDDGTAAKGGSAGTSSGKSGAGGTTPGGGGSAGATGGSGGTAATGGSGGSAGGAPNAVFTCPPGSESLELVPPTSFGAAIAGVPPAASGANDFLGENLEGPVWIDGALYTSNIKFGDKPQPGRIIKYVPGGQAELFIPDSGTNGLALDNQGRLLGATQKDGSISRFDLNNPTAAPVPVVAEYNDNPFNSPNDLAVRSDGNIYFSDPNWQGPDNQPAELAYRASPSGEVTPISRANDTDPGTLPVITKPNGVTLSKDERSLYIGGSSGLYKLTLAEDGSVTGGARVSVINGGVDGMGKDCAGNLYVTNGTNIVILDSSDAPVGQPISLGSVSVTNVAFGGDDHKTLFVTSMSPAALRSVQVNVPGYPY